PRDAGDESRLGHAPDFLTSLSNARQSGRSFPSATRALALERTELRGRRAAVGYSAVVIGVMSAFGPRISRAKPCHVVSPEGTRCSKPSIFLSINETVFSARKRLLVGTPRWSSTTRKGFFAFL